MSLKTTAPHFTIQDKSQDPQNTFTKKMNTFPMKHNAFPKEQN